MPIFEYECSICEHSFELLNPKTKTVKCPVCKAKSRRVIASGKGRAHDDHPAWINHSVREALHEEGARPIESRSDLNCVLKEKGLVHAC